MFQNLERIFTAFTTIFGDRWLLTCDCFHSRAKPDHGSVSRDLTGPERVGGTVADGILLGADIRGVGSFSGDAYGNQSTIMLHGMLLDT